MVCTVKRDITGWGELSGEKKRGENERHEGWHLYISFCDNTREQVWLSHPSGYSLK